MMTKQVKKNGGQEFPKRIPMADMQFLGSSWDPEAAEVLHKLLFEAGEAAGLLKDYSEDEALMKSEAKEISKLLDTAIRNVEDFLKQREADAMRKLEEAEEGARE